MGASSAIRMASLVFWLSGGELFQEERRRERDGWFHRASLLSRSTVPSPRGAEAGQHAPKGEEWYEASDLGILTVESPDAEVRTNVRTFARLESRFHAGEQA
jgi:hypothetical protein